MIANGITSSSALEASGWIWANHEGGHSMGLPDLYLHT